MNSIELLLKNIEYSFKDEVLLTQALTHQSYANDNDTESYERLEFLGDAVIELVISDFIFNNIKVDSGSSTKLRAALVSTAYLCDISTKLGLDKLVLKSRSLQQLSKKNVADLFESLIGAIYIDGGLEPARKIIQKYIIVDDANINFVIKNNKDHKSLLQECLQSEGKAFEYSLVSISGPDHNREFEIKLLIDGVKVSSGKGRSIRAAEDVCAEKYLAQINKL